MSQQLVNRLDEIYTELQLARQGLANGLNIDLHPLAEKTDLAIQALQALDAAEAKSLLPSLDGIIGQLNETTDFLKTHFGVGQND